MNPLLESYAAAIDKRFEPIVGQTEAKDQVRDILLGSALDGFLAPMLFIAPAGFGKSFFLKAVRDLLRDTFGRKTLLATSGSNLGTKAEFFEEIVIPKFHGKKSVIISDEAHEATKGVLSSIRSLLEPTADRCARTIQYNDSDVTFDPFLNSVILATNRIDMLDGPLVSRFERIDLLRYTEYEMATILFEAVKMDGVIFQDGALATLANCNRGNARDIIHWANAIRRRVTIQGHAIVNRESCLSVIKSRKALPEGVSMLELATLLALERRGTLQLKELASMNQCSSEEQNSNEGYLRQKSLIAVDGKRHLTGEGRDYLAMLRREGFVEEFKGKSCEA